MEHVIAMLEAEIDSLKDAYKTDTKGFKHEYSFRILDCLKAKKILISKNSINKDSLLIQLLSEITPKQQKATTEKMLAEVKGYKYAIDKVLNIIEEERLSYYIDSNTEAERILKKLQCAIEKIKD